MTLPPKADIQLFGLRRECCLDRGLGAAFDEGLGNLGPGKQCLAKERREFVGAAKRVLP